jgi:hypothetical protein
MSVLRSIESKLESLFEGVFGRAFRTNVQPVELAQSSRRWTITATYRCPVCTSRTSTRSTSPGDRTQFEAEDPR